MNWNTDDNTNIFNNYTDSMNDNLDRKYDRYVNTKSPYIVFQTNTIYKDAHTFPRPVLYLTIPTAIVKKYYYTNPNVIRQILIRLANEFFKKFPKWKSSGVFSVLKGAYIEDLIVDNNRNIYLQIPEVVLYDYDKSLSTQMELDI